jgi:hypothetical protein
MHPSDAGLTLVGSDRDDAVLVQICGNVAAPPVFSPKQRGVRMRTVYKSNGGQQEGFVREEDAAQALLML